MFDDATRNIQLKDDEDADGGCRGDENEFIPLLESIKTHQQIAAYRDVIFQRHVSDLPLLMSVRTGHSNGFELDHQHSGERNAQHHTPDRRYQNAWVRPVPYDHVAQQCVYDYLHHERSPKVLHGSLCVCLNPRADYSAECRRVICASRTAMCSRPVFFHLIYARHQFTPVFVICLSNSFLMRTSLTPTLDRERPVTVAISS